MLTGSASLDTNAFDRFFKTMVFPLFTQWQDIKVGSKTISPLVGGTSGVFPPAKLRSNLKSDYASRATNAAAHEHLNQLTLSEMERIANGNFHPLCRANAMLAIGELKETDPNGPPYKKALPVLLKAATALNSIANVRLPALRGLLRQATDGIDADSRAAVITAMLAMLNQHTPPAGRSPEEHDWICRRVIDVLSAIGQPGNNGAVPSAMLAVINDGAASLPIRCAAAAALAKVKLNSQPANTASVLVKTLGKLAVEDYKAQLAAASASHTKIPVDEIKQHLNEIRVGLNSLASSPDVAQSANQTIGQIDNLVRACDTKPDEPPVTTQFVAGSAPPIPFDVQARVAKAITAAGESLENTLLKGDSAAAADKLP
jgi:hypothetical protein